MDFSTTKGDRLKMFGARSALVTAVLLAFGLAGVFSNSPGNWLVLLFKILAGYDGVNLEMLYRLNSMDIIILVLEGVAMAGLCAVFWTESRIGALTAVVLPYAGIAVYLVTGLAGRSAFMGAILVISLVMLGGCAFPKWMAWLGVISSVFLLAGDFLLSAAPSVLLAGGFVAAYLGSIAWLCAVAIYLLQRKNPARETRTGDF